MTEPTQLQLSCQLLAGLLANPVNTHETSNDLLARADEMAAELMARADGRIADVQKWRTQSYTFEIMLREVIQQVNQVFSQMLKGEWADGLGHKAQMNQNVIMLKTKIQAINEQFPELRI